MPRRKKPSEPPSPARRFQLREGPPPSCKNVKLLRDPEHLQRIGELIWRHRGPDDPDDSRQVRQLYGEIKGDTKHLLYSHLEWDDSIAAESHRRAQLKSLITHIQVIAITVDEEERPEPAFMSISVPNEPRRYYNRDAIVNSHVLLANFAKDFEQSMAGWAERVASYNEAFLMENVVNLLDQIVAELGRVRAELEGKGRPGGRPPSARV